MYLIQERVSSRNLKPGDLFSLDPLAQIAGEIKGKVNVLIPNDAIAYGHLHIRTETPFEEGDADMDVYRIEIIKEDVPSSIRAVKEGEEENR